jgi:hypothetical protein
MAAEGSTITQGFHNLRHMSVNPMPPSAPLTFFS